MAKNTEVASLSPPAAGEVGEDMDEGDALGADANAVQQGSDRRKLPDKDSQYPQGPKTTRINRERAQSGSPDQGTQ